MFQKAKEPKILTEVKSFDFLQAAGVLIVLFLVFYVLHIGASFIIPFIIALLFSFAILSLSNVFQRYKIPAFISMILSLWVYIVVIWVIAEFVLWRNILILSDNFPEYQAIFIGKMLTLLDYFRIDEDGRAIMVKSITNLDLNGLFLNFGTAITLVFSKVGLIMFYVLFILLEHRHFSTKLTKMIPNKKQELDIILAVSQIKNDIKSYFVIKTYVSLITWSMSYLVLLYFNVQFPLFWAFLIFAFNFIPTVGSVIAVTFPVLLSLVLFDNIYNVIFLFIGLAWVQILMWNIIEPRFVWNKLNLSPLVIILALGFWWYIWWVVWMLLSVPIMVIINIVFSKFRLTRPIAILFSEKWDLKISLAQSQQNRKELVDKIKSRLSF